MKSIYPIDCIIAFALMALVNYLFFSMLCHSPVELFAVATSTGCSGFMYAFLLLKFRELDAEPQQEKVEEVVEERVTRPIRRGFP